MALTMDMVLAATELYDAHFPEWQLSNASLHALRKAFPEWDEESCLLKAAAINELYGTNVYLLVPLARSISRKMHCADPESESDLVESLAIHPTTNSRHVSFSSKLCHFFVDPKKYSILDGATIETLEHFLAAECVSDQRNRYGAFLRNLELIRRKSPELDSAQVDNVALDRFLWLFGLWIRFRKNVGINAEAMRVFSHPPKALMRRLIPNFEDEI